MMKNQKLEKAAVNFMMAANELSQAFDDKLNMNYPFEKSFDEVVSDIEDWVMPFTTSYDKATNDELMLMARGQLYDKIEELMSGGEFKLKAGDAIVDDPFLDTTGRHRVDPIEYYGLESIMKAVGDRP